MTRRAHRTKKSDLVVESLGVQKFAEGPNFSIGDPAFAEWLKQTGFYSESVNEASALGITAFYRACALISGTIAGLPFKVFERNTDGSRVEVDHFLTDNPAGPYDISPFSWMEMLMLHLLIQNETFLEHIYNEGGELIGMWPVHPLAVNKVEWDGPEKIFHLTLKGGGDKQLKTETMTQILGMTTEGLRGISPLTVLRRSLQTTMAGEMAANRSFTGGHLIAGLVTTEEDVDLTEAKKIKDDLNAKLKGPENAGDIAFVNRQLKFSPWTMSNEDAQFIEARGLQVQETARMFGLPVSLLSVSGAVSNWGTGVSESFLGLQKFVLTGWTSRIESALQKILPVNQYVEFDFKGLLSGTPKDEITLLIEQVKAGILTADEAREIMNRKPLPQPVQLPAPTAVPDREEGAA